MRQHITQHGPMDVGTFMSLALGHPQHGYYMKQDPFGAAGDFTTAPEISQMFGEMVGAWMADIWIQMGSPDDFILLECGPGRGTLMRDMMRATAAAKGFHEACNIHLLEMSPVLKDAQDEALKDYGVIWHDTLESVPAHKPLIVIGNEFLDALPFRQLMWGDGQWHERVIGLEGEQLTFGLRAASPDLVAHAPVMANDGDIYEVAPVRQNFVHQVSQRLEAQGGAALFIDYGHMKSGIGDTFQALYKHEYVDVLSHIGDADLTAHVDFESLMEEAHAIGAVEQGIFLKRLGIEHRAQMLSQKASAQQAKDIQSALHRLTHPDEMGTLFKVIGFCSNEHISPAGFS